ncbi:hypothetical protein [Sulfurimonas sp. HSL3-7]|uniref:hypothetical protein n=1 Tax=Sulfonitrofixus jiaomeiensis TaxID=3131938 RepID=UPI0031F948C5
MSDTDLQNMLRQAEEEFKYLEEQCLKNKDDDYEIKLHAIAMITLYNFALNLKLSGSQLIELLYILDENSRLHQNLIAPYLMLLDDMELVCKQYGHTYLMFLSEKAQDKSDEEIMEVLFKK